jgi:hypothetical protein
MDGHHADCLDLAGGGRQLSELFILIEDLEAPHVFKESAFGIYTGCGSERERELQQLVDCKAALLSRDTVIREQDLQVISAPEEM